MGKDVNYRSFVNETGTVIGPKEWTPPTNPGDYDDIFKCSNCTSFTAKTISIPGGREDCFDAVRGADYLLEDLSLTPKGNGGVVFKGSIDGWRMRRVKFHSHGSKSDVELGMFDKYWSPGRKPTRRGMMSDCSSADGQPLVVWVLDADVPTVVRSNVRVRRVPKFVWFPYFLWRWFSIRVFR